MLKQGIGSALLVFLAVVGEAGCVFLALLTSFICINGFQIASFSTLSYRIPWALVFLGIWYAQATDQRLYVSGRCDTLVRQIVDVTKAIASSLLVTVFVSILFKESSLDRPFVLLFCGTAFIYLLTFRLVTRLGLWGLRRRGFHWKHIVLVGANLRSVRLLEVIRAHECYGYQVDGFLENDADRKSILADQGVAYLGPIEELEHLLIDQVVDMVYVTLPVRSHYEKIQSIANLCEGVGVSVRLIGDFFPVRTASSEAVWLKDVPLLTLSAPSVESKIDFGCLFDQLIALVLLIVLSPLMVSIAFLIKVGSPGPLFVKERRFSPRTKHPFNLLRFRTVSRKPSDNTKNGSGELTRIGAYLRARSLDELPFLINVCQGHYRFADPRAGNVWEDELESAVSGSSLHVTRMPLEAVGPAHQGGLASALMLAGFDAIGLLVAFYWAIYDWLPWNMKLSDAMLVHAPYAVFFMVFWYGAAINQRLFGSWSLHRVADYAFAIIKAIGTALVVSTVLMTLLTGEKVNRQFLTTFCLASPLAILGIRLTASWVIDIVHSRGFWLRRTVIIGANDRAKHLIQILQKEKHQQIVGFLDEDPGRAPILIETGCPWLGSVSDLSGLLTRQTIDEIYVCLPLRSSYEMIRAVVAQCEQTTTAVHVIADLFPMRVANSRLMYIEEIPLVCLSAIPEAQFWLGIKRFVDITVSTLLLIPLMPLFFLIGVAIKLESAGPVFFLQQRVGQNQRLFKMIKFRTMVANAEALKKDLEALNEADGPVFKIKNDPRITRLGGFMRKYSVDELPQLINVWVGHMSLVGPRPPIPKEVAEYTWEQRRRLSVRPGMTGLWQVSGRSNVGFEEWVHLDLMYIDTWSIMSDFLILLRTFGAVIKGRGAA